MHATLFLAHRFFFRFIDFFHHWYWDASLFWGHFYVSVLERMDKVFAIRITLRHFFEPLYQDYTIIGRVMGLIFRPTRIFVGLIVYLVWTVVFVAFYLLWLAIPFGVLVLAWRGMRMQ